MSDSLDLLLTRQPSAGRRVGPIASLTSTGSSYAASNSFNRSGQLTSTPSKTYSAQNYENNNNYYNTSSSNSSYSSMGNSGTPLKANSSYSNYSREPVSSPSNDRYYSQQSAESKVPSSPYGSTTNTYSSNSYDRTNSYDSNGSGVLNQPSALGASLANSLTSKLQSSSQPVNWSALKAKRVGSASANAANNATTAGSVAPSAAPTTASTPLASPAKTKLGEESTVIDGSIIFPVRPQSQAQPHMTPVDVTAKRNLFASPAGSPAAAGVGRPAPVSSPTAAVAGDGTAVRQVQTFSCPDCRRNFKRGSLLKHQKVCKKVFQSKRGPFDSSKARTSDLGLDELEGYQDANEEEEDAAESGIRPMTSGGPGSKKKSDEEMKEQDTPSKEKTWKDQSESLREAMRRAKQQKKAFAASNQMGIDLRAMMPKAR